MIHQLSRSDTDEGQFSFQQIGRSIAAHDVHFRVGNLAAKQEPGVSGRQDGKAIRYSEYALETSFESRRSRFIFIFGKIVGDQLVRRLNRYSLRREIGLVERLVFRLRKISEEVLRMNVVRRLQIKIPLVEEFLVVVELVADP